jgi:hypothetical protein
VSKPITHPGDPRVLAAFHAVGGSWHAVAARLEPQRTVFIEAKSFSAGDASGVEAWLASHNVGRVVSILPASSIICRTCNLPNGSPQQLESALKLQAETQLLGSVPSHRLATAVLHHAEGESSRSGLILAWPESSNSAKPPVTRPVTHAPVIASLAALLDGARPDEPIMFVDRKDGSMALSLTHANGAIFRAARVDASADDGGLKSILRSVTETALNVGHTGQFIDEMVSRLRAQLAASPTSDAVLVIPAALHTQLAARLHGAPATAQWWSRFGIAAGAALAASDQLAPLTQMLHRPAATKPSRFRSLSTRLSDRSVAMKMLAACLAIVVFAPVVFSGMRLLILNIRYPDLDASLEEINESKQALAMYSDLKNHAWSMTKVLADLVSSAPEGIELEQIAVDHGKELRVKGTARSHKDASPTEVIGQMHANMQQYHVFKDVRPSWDNPNAQGTSYEFNLMAKIDDPHIRPSYPEVLDFAAMTLADRRYGKQPRPGENQPDVASTELATQRPVEQAPTQAQPKLEKLPVPEQAPSAETGEDSALALDDQPRQGRRPIGRDNTGVADGTNSRGGGGGDPIADRIPEELTEAQIAAMSVAEAMDAQAKVARAIRRAPGIDAETRDRLQREFRLLNDRVREGE